MLLQGKTALITGGSRGIGAALVKEFAAQGADIAFSYRSSKEQADALIAELQPLGRKILAYKSDASSFQDTQDFVQAVLKEFGGLDILVNNAGITRDNLLLRLSEAQWDEVMDNNLKSVFNFSKAVSRAMLKAKQGVILNIGSVVGIQGNAGQSNYAAAKAGLIGFSKSLAQELGSRNIRCNVIAPGFIETEMTGILEEDVQKQILEQTALKRFGKTEEVAQLASFLASDKATYITGEVIAITGGMR